MKASEELREKMWELCYDLLPDDERRALVATIKSDPQVARLYAEVRLQADLVGYASIVEDSSLILSPEGKNSPEIQLAPAAGRSKEVLQPMPVAAKTHAKSAPSDAGKTSWVAWLPAVAALCLMALIGYGTLRPNVGPHQTAEALVTEVEVPAMLPSGVTQQVWVRTLRSNGDPTSAELDVKLIAPDGEVRHHQVVQANEDGLAMVDLPGQAVARGVRIEAAARKESLARDHYDRISDATSDTSSVVSAPLPVATEPPLTYFLQESPNPQPGQPTRYAKYSLSRFGFQMEPADGREQERSVKQLGEQDAVAGELAAGAKPASGHLARTKRRLADGVVEWTAEGPASGAADAKLVLETRDARLPDALGLSQERTTTLADQIDPGKPNADRPDLNPAAGAGAGFDRTYAEGIEKQIDASKLAQNFYREGTRRNYSARRNVQQLDSLASSSGSSPSSKALPMKDAGEREALSELEAAKGAEIAAKQGADDFESKKALDMQRFAEASEATKTKETKEEDKGFAGALAQVDSPASVPAEKTASAGKTQSDFAFFDATRGEPTTIAAGAPVTIAVPSELAEKKLLLEARCREVTVARAAMNPAVKTPTKKELAEQSLLALEGKPGGESQLAKNEVEAHTRDTPVTTWEFALQLPPEVDGDVQVRLIDTSVSPPQLVGQQWFYRQPAKELKLALVAVNGLAEAKNEFKPGEKVSLRFRVLSEHDQPEAALLPVRVWREDAIEASGQEPEMLADVVRSQAALYETSGYANATVRGLERLRQFDTLNRALAMQEQRQSMDLKKADGAFPKVMSVAPKAAQPPAPAPPLAAALPGASPEATTASPPAPAAPAPAPAEAPALVRSDAQPPAPAAPTPAAPEVVPPAPAVEAAAAGNLAYGAVPAASLPVETASTPAESAQLYAMIPDTFAEVTVELPQQPQVVSNFHEIQRQHELAARESAAAWEAWRAVVGRVLVVGGLAALAGLFVLFLLRTPVRAGSGTLALVGGVASLLVGAFWIADGRQALQLAAVAPTESASAAPRPMSRAAASDTREKDEVEAFGQGLGGMPAPATSDEPLQPLAAASAPESAPAGPRFAVAPSGQESQGGQGGPDSFSKEANKESEAASKTGEGFGGFGGGRKLRGGGMGGSGFGGGGLGGTGPGGIESAQPGGTAGAARGSLRTKQPSPADAIAENSTGDKGAADKTESSAAEKPAPQQPAGEGARPADTAGNRGGQNQRGQADSPPTPMRSAVTMKAANATGAGGRPAAVPADGFAPGPTPAPAVAVQERQHTEGEENAAPVTLYFNPRLETDADGYATIELQMPDAEADYRILIDAIGHGRIGSAEMLIMCRK